MTPKGPPFDSVYERAEYVRSETGRLLNGPQLQSLYALREIMAAAEILWRLDHVGDISDWVAFEVRWAGHHRGVVRIHVSGMVEWVE